MELNDTIVSLCSGALKSAIALIRISGKDAILITNKLFTNKKEHLHQHVYYGYIEDENEKIDQVMASFYYGPNSFTGEDVVEITCHGSMLIVNNIISTYIKHGARMATNGEFSSRAFINGKIDLVSAEAINDLINATSKQATSLALSGVEGKTSKFVEELADNLLDIISHIEVNIDYPEYDDVEQLTHDTILPMINALLSRLDKIINDTRKGQIIKNGIDTVIIGKPNVGKSSLLNALIKEDKAIVTDIAGTTRDIVEGTINLDGITLNLIDTAGIRKSDDYIEKIGIDKSLKSLEKAKLVLLVLDGSKGLEEEDYELLEKTKNYQRIIILNKTDKGNMLDIDDSIKISAINKDILELENKIKEKFKDFTYNNEPILFNARQEGLLLQAKQSLESAKIQAMQGQVVDIISIDIKQAYKSIMEILGKVNKENLLDNIFSKFCLGK